MNLNLFTYHVDFKAKDIEVMYLPNYNTLSIEAILEFGKNEPRVASYLPDERDIPRLPR